MTSKKRIASEVEVAEALVKLQKAVEEDKAHRPIGPEDVLRTPKFQAYERKP